jgi:ankyrin repeat protein
MALKKFRHKSDKLDLIDADIALTEREIEKIEKIKTTNQEKQEDLHMISMILENPQINFNTPGENWKTALHIVAEKSMHESMKAFLSSKKFDIIDSQDDSGDTALHIAARKGDIEMVNILLAYEASVIIKNQEGKTAPALLLEFHQKNLDSIEKQQKSITDSMQTDGSSLGEPQQGLQTQQNALIALSHQKDALSVQRTTLSLTTSRLKVIEGASDPNVGLYNAVINNNPEEVARALRNTNPNIEDANKVTPLHIAVEKGNLEIVKLLIDKKAITSRSNLVGETALHIAVRRNIPEIAAHLLKNKPGIYCCGNGFGETSFDLTVEGKNPEMLILHMPHFIKNMKDRNHETFICHEQTTIASCEKILDDAEMKKVFLGFKDENGRSIVHIACANGLKDLVSLFERKGLDFEIQDNNGKTAKNLADERSANPSGVASGASVAKEGCRQQ